MEYKQIEKKEKRKGKWKQTQKQGNWGKHGELGFVCKKRKKRETGQREKRELGTGVEKNRKQKGKGVRNDLVGDCKRLAEVINTDSCCFLNWYICADVYVFFFSACCGKLRLGCCVCGFGKRYAGVRYYCSRR